MGVHIRPLAAIERCPLRLVFEEAHCFDVLEEHVSRCAVHPFIAGSPGFLLHPS